MLCYKNQSMIRWRLRVLMAEKNIKNKTLAEMTGLNAVTISRLKNTDELKQISGYVLNQLCNALECTPNDLMEFTFDKNDPGNHKDMTQQQKVKQKGVIKDKLTHQSSRETLGCSVLRLIPSQERLESA